MLMKRRAGRKVSDHFAKKFAAKQEAQACWKKTVSAAQRRDFVSPAVDSKAERVSSADLGKEEIFGRFVHVGTYDGERYRTNGYG